MEIKHLIELSIFFTITAVIMIGLIAYFPTTPTLIQNHVNLYDTADEEVVFEEEHLAEIDNYLKSGIETINFKEEVWCMTTAKTQQGYEVLTIEKQENHHSHPFYSSITCNDAKATLHTHPPILGTAYPSSKDKQIFKEREHIDCIAQGKINPEQLESEETIKAINCFTQELKQLKTVVR